MANQTDTTDGKPVQEKIKPIPYPLNILENYLKNYVPANDHFDSDGKWEAKYKMFTMASGRAGHAGTLSFKRKSLSGKEAFIELTIDKAGVDRYWQKINAKIKFKKDLLSSPVKWQYEVKVTTPKGKVLRNTEIKKYAVNYEKRIDFVCNGKRKSVKTSGTIALNWLLFDAVQRMPREKNTKSEFTLIDHFDQFKPNNTISFCNNIEINVANNKKLELYVYNQLGDGILPVAYYVNKCGKLLFVVSGVEAYALI
jgi:hypothetical protein